MATENLQSPRIEFIEGLKDRLDKLEKRDFDDALTLIEILSNITFFGSLKMENCDHAKEGQCGLYALPDEYEEKIPIATNCRIEDCNHRNNHFHLELSNTSCAFCPIT